VRHTAAERALYLGQAHEAPDFQSMRRGLRDWGGGSAPWHCADRAEVLLPSSRRLQRVLKGRPSPTQAIRSQDAVSALERLLKLCSHFQVGGGSEVGSRRLRGPWRGIAQSGSAKQTLPKPHDLMFVMVILEKGVWVPD